MTATIWSASSSIFGMISTTADTLSKTINTAAASVDMLDTYVQGARNRQVQSSKIAEANYLENLILESALDQARKEQNIAKELVDPDLKSRFAVIEAKHRALFEPAPTP